MVGRPWLVALCVCLILSGCGFVRGRGDNGGRNGAASAAPRAQVSPTTAPTPTPSPTPAPTPTPTPTPPSTPVAEAALRRALLAIDDLPRGWSAYESDPFPPPCERTPALETQAHALVEQTFGESAFGPFVRHMVASYRPGEAAQALERTRQLFSECPEWNGAYEGREFTFRVSPIDFPDLGDQSFALRLSADGPIFLKVESVLVFVRRGSAVFLLAHTAAGFGGASVDRDLTERLARRADARLQVVADQR